MERPVSETTGGSLISADMGVGDPRPELGVKKVVEGRRASFSWRLAIEMNGLAAGATELPRLPESLAPQGLFSAGVHQPQSSVGEGQDVQGAAAAVAIALMSQKLDSFLSIMMQRDAAAAEREAASQARLDNAFAAMQTATAKLDGLIASMMQREADLDVRDYNRALDLRLACGSGPVEAKFNWMFGHGVTPRTHGKATKSQARFERLQVSLRKFVLWFTDNASVTDLSKVFIQFNDAPRVSISGAEIKDFLLNHEDMSQVLESALIRVLRRDESHREPNSQGSTHYVGKEWARKVVAGGSTSACEELFYLRPKIQYNLAACKKVVVSLDMKQEGWASLTIDFRRCITYLIHPNLSGVSAVDVLHHHIDLMKILTQAAQEHMTKHGGAVIPMVEWEYEVALKTEHHMNGPESGFTTAFYSIPKDNQFMIVSPETIGLAKHTFLYSMVRMSYRSTKRKIPQGKRKKVLKRGRDGKFISSLDPEGSGTSASDAASSA